MTSTPVSLNDESLNGSWIDINSASQIHSPVDNDAPERMGPPYSLAESVRLGLLSFQVERFLQEAQRNQASASGSNQDVQPQQQYQNVDNISDLCFSVSDSDISVDGIQGSNPMIDDSMWDWTSQPEYFSGQEWKVSPPKQDYLGRQGQSYLGASLAERHNRRILSGDIMSLLFLTNILSIIIGAGITYNILMRRSNL